MTRPITWRNVNAPNLDGASRILERSGNRFQSGLARMDQMLEDGAAKRAGIQDAKVANNQDALDSYLGQFQTSETLKAAITPGGEFDTRINGLNGDIDQSASMDYANQRLDTLLNRERGVRDEGRADKEADLREKLNKARLSKYDHENTLIAANGEFSTLLQNKLSAARAERDAEVNKLDSLFTTAGAVKQKDGTYDYDNIDPSMRPLLVAAQERLKGITGADESGIYRNTAQEVGGRYGLSLNDIHTMAQNADSANRGLAGTFGNDAATQQAQLAGLDEQAKSNVYLNNTHTGTPNQVVNSILNSVLVDGALSDGVRNIFEDADSREDIVKASTRLLNNGTIVKGKKVDVPPGVLELAMGQFNPEWYDKLPLFENSGNLLEAAVINVMESINLEDQKLHAALIRGQRNQLNKPTDGNITVKQRADNLARALRLFSAPESEETPPEEVPRKRVNRPVSTMQVGF